MIELQVRMPPIVGFGANKEIQDWIDEAGLKITGGNIVINPETFEPKRSYYFENEEDKTLFLLKWSNMI